MEPKAKTDPWDCFDKIYCISIDEREDRRASARIQFSRVGLADRVEFVIVGKHPLDSEQGIYESHIKCIKMGLENGARTTLIFEDDIIFNRFNRRALANCVSFVSENRDWGLFFLGCLVSGSRKTENSSVVKVKYRSLAHAYAVERRMAEKLADKPWQHVAYDAILRSMGDKSYAAYPSFAFQSNSATDNTRNLNLDRWRKFCGGFVRIQKRNEFYHRHRPLVIAAHACFFLIILVLAIWSKSTPNP